MFNRNCASCYRNTFLVGVPFTVAVIELPLRFQAVNGMTPFNAGVGLLPFAFCSPFGSAIAAMVASKLKVMPIYILFVGATLQTIGVILLSFLGTSENVQPAQYAFEVITALGTGSNIGILILMTPFVVEGRDRGKTLPLPCDGQMLTDLAVASGAIVQFRMMGGAIGLAIVTSYMNSWLTSGLSPILSPDQLGTLLESTDSINTFQPELQTAVRTVFAQGFNEQFKIVIAFTVAQFPATLLLWQKKGIRVH